LFDFLSFAFSNFTLCACKKKKKMYCHFYGLDISKPHRGTLSVYVRLGCTQASTQCYSTHCCTLGRYPATTYPPPSMVKQAKTSKILTSIATKQLLFASHNLLLLLHAFDNTCKRQDKLALLLLVCICYLISF